MVRSGRLIRGVGLVALVLLSPADARGDVTVLAGMTSVGRAWPSLGVAFFCSTGTVSAQNFGVGLKRPIAGRLSLRLEYRLFRLGDASDANRGPSTSYPQRLAAGLHFAF